MESHKKKVLNFLRSIQLGVESQIDVLPHPSLKFLETRDAIKIENKDDSKKILVNRDWFQTKNATLRPPNYYATSEETDSIIISGLETKAVNLLERLKNEELNRNELLLQKHSVYLTFAVAFGSVFVGTVNFFPVDAMVQSMTTEVTFWPFTTHWLYYSLFYLLFFTTSLFLTGVVAAIMEHLFEA